MVTCQTKNVISPISQGLWTPNVAGWGLRIRGLHLQSHVTYQSRAHVSIKNVLSPHSQGPRLMAHGLQLHGSWPSRPRVYGPWPRTWYCAESGWGSPTLKVTWHLCGHVKTQNRHIFSTTWPSRCKRKACTCQKIHKNANRMLRSSRSWLI